MASEAQYPVVIVYEHALLGEGIAKYLRAQAGVEAMVASAGDPVAVTSALALNPSVVIFELSDPIQQMALAALAPGAVLVDVSTVITRGASGSHCVAGLEQILQAVGHSSTLAVGDSSTLAAGDSSTLAAGASSTLAVGHITPLAAPA